MGIKSLLDYTGQLLEIERFRDYCPNGLQVEGRPQVKTLISGVSASQQLLEAAAEAGADAILVHHGWFWKNDALPVTGIRRRRLKFLLEREINLVAYHLPLDAHPRLGNNAQLAQQLGFDIDGWFGEQQTGAYGVLQAPSTLLDLGVRVERALRHKPLLIGEPQRQIRSIAWCTGAAQDYLQLAIELGVDAFLTGEVSEHTVHLSRESGVAFIAAGHHATERGGIKALGEHLAAHFGLTHRFIDIDNPA
ncbi:MAG TPA: Nif3-like dinuclear metal center hexameric protein [Novimethylophilus sp.]|jgi:dinuclear metal center YbgI/SA1388 family protein|uniref:Nif3-like dinuclear metal center hexameric protein n=1 Tax=Novimethylophilus sp. TaxID=2137426 RepID=UPI002F3FAAF0